MYVVLNMAKTLLKPWYGNRRRHLGQSQGTGKWSQTGVKVKLENKKKWKKQKKKMKPKIRCRIWISVVPRLSVSGPFIPAESSSNNEASCDHFRPSNEPSEHWTLIRR